MTKLAAQQHLSNRCTMIHLIFQLWETCGNEDLCQPDAKKWTASHTNSSYTYALSLIFSWGNWAVEKIHFVINISDAKWRSYLKNLIDSSGTIRGFIGSCLSELYLLCKPLNRSEYDIYLNHLSDSLVSHSASDFSFTL